MEHSNLDLDKQDKIDIFLEHSPIFKSDNERRMDFLNTHYLGPRYIAAFDWIMKYGFSGTIKRIFLGIED